MYRTFMIVDQLILETLVQTLASNQDAIVCDDRGTNSVANATLSNALHAHIACVICATAISSAFELSGARC